MNRSFSQFKATREGGYTWDFTVLHFTEMLKSFFSTRTKLAQEIVLWDSVNAAE